MKPGQRSYVPGIGYIAIISVEPVELARLTDADAVLDGFPTADQLRAEILTLYTVEAQQTLTPYRIRFSVYPPKEQLRIKKERQRQKQAQKHQRNRDALRRSSVTQALDKLQKMCEKNGSESEPAA